MYRHNEDPIVTIVTIDPQERKANTFADKYGVKLTILGHDYRKHFFGDKQARYVYRCRLQRGLNSYAFDFGQSIANAGQEPTMYDVLCCLQKYDVGDLQDFIDEFSYDPEIHPVKRIYRDVRKEYEAVERLFSDVMDELREIQ